MQHFGRPGSFPFIFRYEEAHNWKIPMAHSIKVSVLAFVCPGVRIVLIGKDHSEARKLWFLYVTNLYMLPSRHLSGYNLAPPESE